MPKRKRSSGDEASLKDRSHPRQNAENDIGETPVKWKITYPGFPIVQAVTAVSRHAQMHRSPFEAKNQKPDALDCTYLIEPHDRWWSMTKYSNFVILDDKYTSQEFVFVKPDGLDENRAVGNLEDDYWIARCLEVRASDPSHVYALVAWMYWPRELPKCRDATLTTASGRRSYHGRHELVASNHLEILDVTSFAGKATVEQWMEDDEEDVQKHLYWRQTFNHQTSLLSDIRRHCICNQYYNPDLVMIACDKKICAVWLHAQCLINDVLTRTYNRLVKTPASQEDETPKAKKSKKGTRRLEERLYKGVFAAEIIDDGVNAPQFQITDLRAGIEDNKKTWREDVKCLKCDTKVE